MKVGRNEPCPCGSGRKYKHCCMRNEETRSAGNTRHHSNIGGAGDAEIRNAMLAQTGFSSMEELDAAMKRYELHCENLPNDQQPPTFMEFLGKRPPAPGLFSELHELAASREFSSKEELEAELNRNVTSANAQPIDDFEGLSSDDIHAMLYNPSQSKVFAINGALANTTAFDAPVVQQIAWALLFMAQSGGEIKLTQRENFNRKMCESYLRRFAGWWKPGDPIPPEQALPNLSVLHDLLLSIGYADASRTRMWITPEGLDVLTKKKWSQVFQDAIIAAIGKFDWRNWLPPDRWDDRLTFVEQSCMFSLYLLKRHPSGTTQELFDRFVRAFPAFIEPAGNDEKMVDYFRAYYIVLFVSYFSDAFGLVELQDETRVLTEYKVTDLFHAAFVWMPKPER
ncbi:MAG: YecA family protein [Spirochaetota bacterium]